MSGSPLGPDDDLCPRCRGRLHGFRGADCPWCGGRLAGNGPSMGSERPAKRLMLMGVVALALIVWALAIPSPDWNALNTTVFGTIAVFMLLMAWVLSGEMIDE